MVIYFDMDGVLAVFDKEKTLDDVARPGYFLSVAPQENIVETARLLIACGYKVGIKSAALYEHSKEEKVQWLKKLLPEIPEGLIYFTNYGQKKEGSCEDILIDDFTDNLLNWQGTGIKLYNGINGTKGRWNGYSLSINSDAVHLANQIIAIAEMMNRRRES